MQTRTKVIGGLGAMATATIAGLVMMAQPCSTPKFAFPGDKIGSQCFQVPDRMYTTMLDDFLSELPSDVDKTIASPSCLPNYRNSPCWVTIDDRKVMVSECLKRVEASVNPRGYYWVRDPSCEAVRARRAGQ